MKSPDVVFSQLANLYEFYREISKFKVKAKRKPNKAVLRGRESASRFLRNGVPR